MGGGIDLGGDPVPAFGNDIIATGHQSAKGTAGTGEHLFPREVDGAAQKVEFNRRTGGHGRTGDHGWLPRKDSNLERENQNLLCYHYTTG